MKVSYSGKSEESGVRNQESGGLRDERALVRPVWFGVPRAVVALAAVYVAVHLAFLAPSLEDIDSINFALGLRQFDVANHQPHPPGYPVYIALGRVSQALTRAVAPSRDLARNEATALAIWSAVGAGLALLAVWSIFTALDSTRSSALDGRRDGGQASPPSACRLPTKYAPSTATNQSQIRFISPSS